MGEVGIDLPSAPPKSVFERYRDHERFAYVITLCDPASGEQTPIFLANVDALYGETAQRVNWVIPNFRSLRGSDEERKAAARRIRDRIRTEVVRFLSRLRLNGDRG